MAPRSSTARSSTARKKKSADFWENYKDEGGGKYLTAADKNELIDGAVPLQITNVRYDEKNQFQGNPMPRFVVTFLVPDEVTNEQTERFAGFAISEEGSSRDRLLEALVDYLEAPGAAPVFVILQKIGNFVAIVKADV